MKKINIFLDDIRNPEMSHNDEKGLGSKLKWTIVRDYKEFVESIENHFDEIDIISFDHDLADFKGGAELTGKTCAEFLVNFCLDNDKTLPDWYVHSDNTSGRANIIGLLMNFLIKCEKREIIGFRSHHRGLIRNKPV